MWTFKDMNVHLHVQSSKLLVHVSGVHCHMYVSSTSCTFVYFVEQYFIEYSIIISFFQSRRSRRKHKSSGGVADTAKKRFTTKEMKRGFSLFEEVQLAFEPKGPKCRMVQKGCSSCSECHPVLPCHLWWKRQSFYPDITGSFFSRRYW